MRRTPRVRSDYDTAAETYDTVRFGTPGGNYADSVEKEFVARAARGPRVLEVGTATGRFAIVFVRIGFEYTGIDISNRMLRVTSKRVRALGGEASLLQMDVGHMGFRRHFDSVICVRTFHFLPSPIDALRNIKEALDNGGRCLVTFETDNPLRRLLLGIGLGKAEQRYYRRTEVEKMFRESGFHAIQGGAVMRMPVTFYRRCPSAWLRMLRRLEGLWLWAMHEYVLGDAHHEASTRTSYKEILERAKLESASEKSVSR